ncbi:hypothetical protein DRE_01207 [Drechslerella stenobrocha 248]|uniref:Peptidase A1 domain-containing protein n=1 Tax=Drechslerella stenobrocha 248 TaxID=1043628 RepID=W7HK51_9PEZI|nr:hypothetical protein DRE_01207 [Drechslerella stenobrocha 248]
MYLSPVSIGGQKFNFDLDTGSSDLWVFSNKLPASIQRKHKSNGGKIYTPGPTAKNANGLTWSITYVDNSGASGTVVTDNVKIGGITVKKQAVEVASRISAMFEDFEGDGLLVSPTKQQTWFENAMSQLQSKLFTADLNQQSAGSYGWGYINSIYSKKIAYAKIRNTGWWHVDAGGGIRVNGKLTTTGASYTAGAVPDTGTTLLLLPNSLVKLYYASVPKAQYSSEAGAWVYPCTPQGFPNLPPLSIPVGKSWATIPGKYLTYAYANSAGTSCFGGLQGLSDSSDLPFIYGDIFFKANFAVFDYGNKRFGFAQKR